MKKLSVKKKAAIAATAVLCAVLLMTMIYGCMAFISLESNPVKWSFENRKLMVLLDMISLLAVIWVAFFPGWYED